MKEVNYGQLILERKKILAKKIVDLQTSSSEYEKDLFGETDLKRRFENASYELEYLAEAINFDHPELFTNHILWLTSVLQARGSSWDDIILNLDRLGKVIEQEFDEELFILVSKLISKTRLELQKDELPFSSFINEDNPYRREVEEYLNLLLSGKREEAHDLVHDLMKEKNDLENIYKYIFHISQYEIGYLWQMNKITVPQEHYCTAATQYVMSTMYPYIFSSEKIGKSMVTCSMSGDLHEMGGRMLSDFFELSGWDTHYFGAGMSSNDLQKKLIENKANLLSISVSIPGNLNQTKEIISDVRANKDLKNVKILVGGYVLKMAPNLWKKLGADGFAGDANEALQLANELCV